MSKGSGARRRWLFQLVLAVLLLALLEGVSAVAIAWAPGWLGRPILRASERLELHAAAARRMQERRAEALAEFDRDLGWRPRPGVSNSVDQINSLGLRSDREYAESAPANVIRVSVFGDSFVYGSEVSGKSAWPAQLEEMSNFEVLNYGVPGFGPDQALLRFEAEAQRMKPDWVLLGIGPIAAARVVSVTSAFRQPLSDSFTKPRFELDAADGLRLVPNPYESLEQTSRFGTRDGVIELGQRDYWYPRAVYENPLHDWLASVRLLTALTQNVFERHIDPDRPLAGPRGAAQFNPHSTSFRLMTRIALRFEREVRRMPARPAVIVLPDQYSLQASLEGKPGICDPLLDYCRERGLTCWDGTHAFVPAPAGQSLADWFKDNGHYSKLGSEQIARWLARRIAKAEAASR